MLCKKISHFSGLVVLTVMGKPVTAKASYSVIFILVSLLNADQLLKDKVFPLKHFFSFRGEAFWKKNFVDKGKKQSHK